MDKHQKKSSGVMVQHEPSGNSVLFSRSVFALTAIYFIPVLLPSLFGWMLGMLAVPVAFILSRKGYKQTGNTLVVSLLLAGMVGFLTGRLLIFASILPLVALGYSLFRSGQQKRSPAQAAAWGLATTAGCLFFFLFLYAQGTGSHPYQQLVRTIDAGIVSAGDMYRQSVDVSADMQKELTAVLSGMREWIPKILPSLLISMLLVTVWMNQVLWNGLLLKTLPKLAPWQSYATWKLPEQLVWLPICAAACYIFGPESWQVIALNGLIISGVLYFFQGLAVFFHLVNRWNVPGYLRILLYGMLIIQSYGMILLSLLGIADIWMNIRPAPIESDSPGAEAD
ncbi:MAG TPA: DUF2232 domain-containing protein [Desulfobulbaceae bacterium]|nr:DUF2232 domain-containing protein [Desulfobulbaceae bacterium]